MEKSAPGPLITLTTDFGLTDHYVGTMRGVLISLCPQARLIDISHDIEPFSVWSAAYVVGQAARYFPAGTVHVIVVDPGVGTERKGVLVEASGQSFVAPDNGVLSFILLRDQVARIHAIENRRWWLESPSTTFHGRDIFAPVAAAIACGSATPDDIGPALSEIHVLPGLHPEERKPGVWHGRILSRDRFGNLITNFETGNFRTGAFTIQAGDHHITQHRATFGEAPPDEVFHYFGSSGFIEIGMNQKSAARRLGLNAGDEVLLEVVNA